MTTFIKNILSFVPFAMAVYLIALFAWGMAMPEWVKSNLNYRLGSHGYMYSRMNEVKTVSDVDVLFLGSSHAYRGFDPRLFANAGLNAFNLGSSAQTPIQTEVLLNRYLDQLNPRTIIYEVYPATFAIDGVESSLDIVSNDRNDIHSVSMALALNNAKTYNTLAYASMRDMLNLNASFREPRQKDSDTYVSGGYVEKRMAGFRYVEHPKQQWEFDTNQFRAFEAILDEIKKRDIRLILVQAPVTPSLYHSYTNNALYDSLMTAYGEYYNFNEMMTLDDSLHFYDEHHLNQSGVEDFNYRLLGLLFETTASF